MNGRVFDGQIARAIAPDDRAREERLKATARALVTAVRDGLVRDGAVRLHGFGTFRLRPVAARRGRHPRTGEPIDIPAGWRVMFRPAKALRERIEPDQAPALPIGEPHASREAMLAASAAAAAHNTGRSAGRIPAEGVASLRPPEPERAAAAAMPEAKLSVQGPIPAGPGSDLEADSRVTRSPAALTRARAANEPPPNESAPIEPGSVETPDVPSEKASATPARRSGWRSALLILLVLVVLGLAWLFRPGPPPAPPVAEEPAPARPDQASAGAVNGGQRAINRGEAGPAVTRENSATDTERTSATETGIAETGAGETSTAETSAAEPSAAEPSTAEPSAAEPSAAEPSTAETRAAGTDTADMGSAGTGTAETSTAETTTGKLESVADGDRLDETPVTGTTAADAPDVPAPSVGVRTTARIATPATGASAEAPAGDSAPAVVSEAGDAGTGITATAQGATADTADTAASQGESGAATSERAATGSGTVAEDAANMGVADGSPYFSGRDHTVRAGDTLWDLADRNYVNPYYWPHIWNHNGDIANPDRLEVRQGLWLPTLEGEPQALTEADRRSIAEGYLRLYRFFLEQGDANPQYALVGVRYFDASVMPDRLRGTAAGRPGDTLAAAFHARLEAEFPLE